MEISLKAIGLFNLVFLVKQTRSLSLSLCLSVSSPLSLSFLFIHLLQIYTPEGTGNVTWNTNYQDAINRPLTWFLSYVYVPPASPDGAYVLDLMGMTKGFLYFNGYNLGRYWMIKSNLTAPGCGYCNYQVG